MSIPPSPAMRRPPAARPRPLAYNHQLFEPRRRFTRWLCTQVLFRFTIKVDGCIGLEHFPRSGPAIMMYNHIAFVDPLVVMWQVPRNIVPLAKVEVMENPLMAIIPWMWQVIPVRRGEVDRRALSASLHVLEAGEVILVAPEGTRAPALLPAKEGVAYLASRSGAPVIPVAVEGTEGFPSASPARWRQSGATVRLGRPFRFRGTPNRARGEELQAMTAEAMYVLAAMLPERRRGAYADLAKATTKTIEWMA